MLRSVYCVPPYWAKWERSPVLSAGQNSKFRYFCLSVSHLSYFPLIAREWSVCKRRNRESRTPVRFAERVNTSAVQGDSWTHGRACPFQRRHRHRRHSARRRGRHLDQYAHVETGG